MRAVEATRWWVRTVHALHMCMHGEAGARAGCAALARPLHDGAPMLRDPRDAPVLKLIAKMLVMLVPLAVLLFAHFHLAVAALYLWVVVTRLMAPFSGLIHEIVHRPIFTRRWLRAGRAAVEWIICPLFGLAPYLYAAQHVGMHHPENNLTGDASATIGYRRDSVADFLRYFARFFFLAHWEVLAYLRRAKKARLFRRAAIGLAAHHAVTALALLLEWRAALVVLVFPYFWARLSFAAGNWAQHAFVDPAAPQSPYRNTITCTDAGFNAWTFNSGYHSAHHADLRVHWSELPGELARHRDRYRDEQAIIFEGIEYGHVFLALMQKRYRWLAERHAGTGEPVEVIAERLARRTRRLPHPEPALRAEA